MRRWSDVSVLRRVLLATAVTTRTALADEGTEPNAFEWNAPPECPSRAEIAAAIQGLSRAGAVTPDLPLRASATVNGPPWTARIQVDRGDEHGERVLEASTCAALGHAVALVVAVAIDRAEPRPPPPPPPPIEAPKVAPEVGVDTPPNPRPRSERFAVHAGATFRSGLLPSISPGAELGGSTAFGALELALRGALFARSTEALTESDPRRSAAASSFTLLTVEARASWILRPTNDVRLLPFGGVALGYLRGEGRGTDVDGSASDWLPIPFLGGEARLRVSSHLEGYLGADAGLPLGRSSFLFRGAAGPVHEPSAITARMSAGLRFALF